MEVNRSGFATMRMYLLGDAFYQSSADAYSKLVILLQGAMKSSENEVIIVK